MQVLAIGTDIALTTPNISVATIRNEKVAGASAGGTEEAPAGGVVADGAAFLSVPLFTAAALSKLDSKICRWTMSM